MEIFLITALAVAFGIVVVFAIVSYRLECYQPRQSTKEKE